MGIFSGAETAVEGGEGGGEELGIQVMRGREVEDIAQEWFGSWFTGKRRRKWGCC
jgi:hypothetical protein